MKKIIGLIAILATATCLLASCSFSDLFTKEHICEEYEYNYADWHGVVIENFVQVTANGAGSWDEVLYCRYCGKEMSREHKVYEYSNGISYELSEDGSYYSVLDVGDTFGHYKYDGSSDIVVIPSEYNGKPVTEISDGLPDRRDNYNVKVIVIPDSITKIGNKAFERYYALESIVGGKNIQSIGAKAFYLCESLVNFDIHDSVTSIGDEAFNGCSSLKSIVFPEGTTSIKLSGCSSLNSIAIPNGVESVCLDWCNSLESVIIPNGATSVELSDCASLHSISIPSSVVNFYVGDGCDDLSEIIVGEGSYVAGNNVADDANLNIYFNEINAETKWIKGLYLYIIDKPYSIFIGKNVTGIPEGYFGEDYSWGGDRINSVEFEEGSSCAYIGVNAFRSQENLTDINFPDSIVSIGDEAFLGCGIERLVLGGSLNTIGTEAFYGCINLESVTIGGEISSIGVGAFDYCTGLKTIVMGDNVTDIGDRAFENCVALESITIGCNVTSIGNGSFKDCTALGYITFNDALKVIGDNAFEGCINLKSFAGGINISEFGEKTFAGCCELENVTINENVKTIGNYAFSGCLSFTEFAIPETVTSLGYGIVNGCTGIKNLYINQICYEIAEDKYMFSNLGGEAGVNIIIGNKVTKIPSYMFYGCKINNFGFEEGSTCSAYEDNAIENCSINIWEIGENVTYISTENSVTDVSEIYYNAVNMEDFNAENIVQPYGLSAVVYNYSSKVGLKVTIGKNVTRIPANCFYYCPKLTSIVFENSGLCQTIGKRAFYYCQYLEEVCFDAISMYDLSSDNDIFENAGTKGSGIVVTIGKNVTKIPNYFFYNYVYEDDELYYWDFPNVSQVVFEAGSSCRIIGANAFSGCGNLRYAEIGENVNEIGSGAFRYCFKLIEVYNKSDLPIEAGHHGYIHEWSEEKDYYYTYSMSSGKFYQIWHYGVARYAISVHTTEESALKKVDDFVFLTSSYDGENFLVDYVGNDSVINLPNDYNGDEYSIYSLAFYDRDIDIITIPESVSTIYRDAFLKGSIDRAVFHYSAWEYNYTDVYLKDLQDSKNAAELLMTTNCYYDWKKRS